MRCPSLYFGTVASRRPLRVRACPLCATSSFPSWGQASCKKNMGWGETKWDYPFNNDQGWTDDGLPAGVHAGLAKWC